MLHQIYLTVSMIILTIFLFFSAFFRLDHYLKSNLSRQLALGAAFGLMQYIFFQYPIPTPFSHRGPIFMGGTLFITAAVFGGGIAAFMTALLSNVMLWWLGADHRMEGGPPHNPGGGPRGDLHANAGHLIHQPPPVSHFPINHLFMMLMITIIGGIAFKYIAWRRWKTWLMLNVMYEVYMAVSLPDSPASTLIRAIIEISCGALIYYFILYMYNANERLRKLEENANTDPLTGLNNVRFFKGVLNKLFTHAQKGKRDLALILLDLDYFKKVNDAYGHPAGDRVLHEFVNLMRNMFGSDAVLSRNGGEEFTVLLTSQDRNFVQGKAENFRKMVENHAFLADYLETPLHLTMSAGVVIYEKEIKTPQEMYEQADWALYAAKNGGRNRIVTLSGEDLVRLRQA